MLALVADGVGPAQEQGVIEGSVDRLGIVAAPVEPLEVWVARRDRSDVLGAVELPAGVVIVAVEPDADLMLAEVGSEFVVVVPALLVLVGVAVGADPSQRGEERVAVGDEGADADRSALGEQRDRRGRPVVWASSSSAAASRSGGVLAWRPSS